MAAHFAMASAQASGAIPDVLVQSIRDAMCNVDSITKGEVPALRDGSRSPSGQQQKQQKSSETACSGATSEESESRVRYAHANAIARGTSP